MTQSDGSEPWIGWLGDDFTGAAAVMEVLAFAGVSAVLFTEIPSRGLAERFVGARGIGLATIARSQPPDVMQETLAPAFAWLAALSPTILHYKLC